MLRKGVRFVTPTPPARAAAGRADVAAFVGFVSLRGGLPPAVGALLERRWQELGWGGFLAAGGARGGLPVVVESVEAFDLLFDGEVVVEADGAPMRWEGYLAGAVRDFFRQGGRRAWIVPCGPAAAFPVGEVAALDALDALVPGLVQSPVSAPDRRTWRGIGHLLGLPEVSLLCVPDLVACLGAGPPAPVPEPEPPPLVPQFLECTAVDLAPLGAALPRVPEPPRAGPDERQRWVRAVRAARAWCADPRHQLDLTVVLAPPLPLAKELAERDPLAAYTEEALLGAPDAGGIGSAWLQCAWPWIEGDTTAARPGRIAPADGLFAGILARAALEQGTFRSVMGQRPIGVRRGVPTLTAEAVDRRRPASPLDAPEQHLSLGERMCLLGATPQGLRVLSDVTLSAERRWRQGGSSRLWAALRCNLRRIGEQFVFESNAQATWRNVETAVENLLAAWAAEGAFADPREPGIVRCDRGTMSQADLDAGRLLVQVEVTPAQSIEGIEVVMTIEGGRTSFGTREAA